MLARNPEIPPAPNGPDDYGVPTDRTASPATPGRSKFRLVPHCDITVGSAAVYLIKGLIPRVGLTVIWGTPKCGKTYLVYDAAMHVALGREYRGRRVKGGPVVYLVAEGASGFKARVEAFRREKLRPDEPEPPFFMIEAAPSLVRDYAELARSIRDQIGKTAPALVVIDTLNRTFEGSESSDADMTAFVNAAHAVKATFECAVVVVHHSGLDASRMRGHTALLGAADASLSIKRDAADNIVMAVEAMKDGPAGDVILSRLRVVEVGSDEDGDPITACVVEEARVEAVVTSKQPTKNRSKAAEVALAALTQALADAGEIPPTSDHIPTGVRCVSVSLWRTYAYQRGISTSEEPRARQVAFKRASAELIASRAVVLWEPWVWTAREESKP